VPPSRSSSLTWAPRRDLQVRISPALVGQEVQQPRLRHEHDVGEPGRQAAKRQDRVADAAGRQADLRELRVRQRVQRPRQPHAVEQLQRRGVDRVAAEVAVEVAVRLQQCHVHPLPRQQQGEEHAARPAADHTAARFGARGAHALAPTGDGASIALSGLQLYRPAA